LTIHKKYVTIISMYKIGDRIKIRGISKTGIVLSRDPVSSLYKMIGKHCTITSHAGKNDYGKPLYYLDNSETYRWAAPWFDNATDYLEKELFEI